MSPSEPHVTSPRVLGERGEDAAARWYQNRGFAIVERNWHCREGELDLIASNGSITVFCEVKSRAHDRFGDPALAVGYRKQVKLRRAAMRWLETQPWQPHLRFDVAVVVRGQIRVIEDAF